MKIKIVLFLSIMSIWLLPIDLYALTPVNNNYERLDGVTMNYTGGSFSTNWNEQFNNGFLFFTNGYGYLDYDGASVLGNGLMPQGDYYINSTNSRYSKLEIGPLIFNIYEHIYEFELIKTTTTISIYMVYTTDALWNNDYTFAFNSAQQDLMYIRIYDNQYVNELGVNNAFEQGSLEGYARGFDRASLDYGYVTDLDELLTAEEYGLITYNDGYANGIATASTNALAIRNMIPGILGVTFAFFFQLASISFLGISALDLIGAMITIATSIFIIRIFLNR